MKVPTDQYRALIVCNDGKLIKGFVYVPQGLRLLDFLNDTKENFIAITDARFPSAMEMYTLRLYRETRGKSKLIFLNKNAVKWVEEIK